MSKELDFANVEGTQGWRQFVGCKLDMLYKYDLAKIYSKSDIVQARHGKVGEALVREWLATFLPKRFAVTSGRIICQGLEDTSHAPHYDAIIYDQLSSPILWIEPNPDESSSGSVRAIPAEYSAGKRLGFQANGVGRGQVLPNGMRMGCFLFCAVCI
jgi:hypothetical protein